MSEALPEKLAPIWLEALITSEYERDTLPLLFSGIEDFDTYFEDLLAANDDSMAPAIREMKNRNLEAREERAMGHWPECLLALERAVQLRLIAFPESHPAHHDYVLSLHHLMFSLITFGTWFLKESGEQEDLRVRDVHEIRAFELFGKAKGLLEAIKNKQEHWFFKALLFNNMANYYWRRRKQSAATQVMLDSHRAWVKTKQVKYGYYFYVQYATSLLVMGRYESAMKAMQHAVSILPDNGPVPGTSMHEPEEDDSRLPLRFQPQLLSSALPLVAATCLTAYHNFSLAMVGARKYKDAALWCAKCMDVAAAHRSYLRVNHPWVKSIKRLQEYCTKMSFSANFEKFRMKPSETRSRAFPNLHKLVTEAQRSSPTVALDGTAGSSEHLANDEGQASIPPRTPPPNSEHAPRPPSNQRAAAAPRRPKESNNVALAFLPNIPPKGKPLAALKVYAGGMSHRRIVEDFTNKRNVRPKPKPKDVVADAATDGTEALEDQPVVSEAAPEEAPPAGSENLEAANEEAPEAAAGEGTPEANPDVANVHTEGETLGATEQASSPAVAVS
uniref:Uncharacterized protein n=1 Tax=Eutreptiella gymnastica TaxID=73025 RepID=A0A7S1IBH6_9EUGL|mmetsp:Transcript_144841/g.252566  ORF Transcript_144841/g.252566 Transcript_144841/m.252566 type:complete len:559 (+) Transcript_144841:60-1736(+)